MHGRHVTFPLASLLLWIPCASLAPLNATLAVANFLPNGSLPILEGTGEILIEVGANSRNTMDREAMHLAGCERAFLLTFEPILDKYATLLSRNSRADRKSPLGHHHERGMIFPFAVSPDEGVATLHLDGDLDGCASLLPSANARFNKIALPLTQPNKRRGRCRR